MSQIIQVPIPDPTPPTEAITLTHAVYLKGGSFRAAFDREGDARVYLKDRANSQGLRLEDYEIREL